jgi:hypothetical protein
MAQLRAYEDNLKALPDVVASTEGTSKAFKAKAKAVIANDLPKWHLYAIKADVDQEAEEEDEEDVEATLYAGITLAKRPDDVAYLYKKVQAATGLKKANVNEILLKLFDHVRIFTNNDLVKQLKAGAKWLNRRLTDAKWMALTERLSKNKGQTHKSAEWALSLAWDALERPPWCAADFTDRATLVDMVKTGTHEFVAFDDAAYSGTQKATQVGNVFRVLREAWNDEQPPITVYMVIPFMTQVAIDRFCRIGEADIAKKVVKKGSIELQYSDGHRILIWLGGVLMPSTIEVLKGLPDMTEEKAHDLSATFLDSAGSLCIFEHKVPDYMSLPWLIGETFQKQMWDHYKHTPPYKPHVAPLSPMTAALHPTRSFKCTRPESPSPSTPSSASSGKSDRTIARVDSVNSVNGGTGGAARYPGGAAHYPRHKYNGRSYKLHIGSRGGRFVVVAKKKVYV